MCVCVDETTCVRGWQVTKGMVCVGSLYVQGQNERVEGRARARGRQKLMHQSVAQAGSVKSRLIDSRIRMYVYRPLTG